VTVDTAGAVDAGKAGAGSCTATTPSSDPSTLAVQMMNVAMQLLQSRNGGQPPPGMHQAVPHSPAQPQSMGMMPHMHHVHGQAVQGHPAHSNVGMMYPEAQVKATGDGMQQQANTAKGAGEDGQHASTGPDDSRDATAGGVPAMPVMGFKPHALQAQYIHGYGFPAMPGMHPSLPHVNMVDQVRDSKLRPPAA
jgi:hypothetical protein